MNICDFDFVFNNIFIQNTTFRNLNVKLLQWAENRQKVSGFRRLVLINKSQSGIELKLPFSYNNYYRTAFSEAPYDIPGGGDVCNKAWYAPKL